jgi:two-component SAPR family response regulator
MGTGSRDAALDRNGILKLEREILGGRCVDERIGQLDRRQLALSPLLMKEKGEILLCRGRLLEAQEVLADALRGLADGAMQQAMLSAMALLAMVHLRTGQPGAASTLLKFLRDEAAGQGSEPCSGHVEWALALGGHLIGVPPRAAAVYYAAAADKFADLGDWRRTSLVLADQLFRQYFEAAREDWFAALHRLDHAAAFDSEAQRLGRLLRAFDAFMTGRSMEAAVLLNEASEEAPAAGIWSRLSAELARQLQLFRGNGGTLILDGGYPEVTSPDLEAKSLAEHTRYLQVVLAVNREEALLSESRQNSMEQLGLHPVFRSIARRLREMAAEAGAASRTEADTATGATISGQTEAGIPAGVDGTEDTEAGNAAGADDAEDAPHTGGSAKTEAGAAAKTDAVETREPKPRAWRIYWFGGLALECGSNVRQRLHWKRKKSLELFLLLLSRPRYTVPKDWALEILFGDTPPKNATNQLYVAVHQLKKTLREQLGVEQGVLQQSGTIRLREDWIECVDIEQYTALVRVGDQLWLQERDIAAELYERAAEMYGEALPELPYIEWLENCKQQLMEQQARILQRLADLSALNGRYEAAAEYGRRWTQVNPLQEEAYQTLLKALMQLGKAAEAREWFARWEALCRRELDMEPHPDTRKILTR